jgi:hypothetical protein
MIEELVFYLDRDGKQFVRFIRQWISRSISFFADRFVQSDETIAGFAFLNVARSNRRTSFDRFAQSDIEHSIIDNEMGTTLQIN